MTYVDLQALRHYVYNTLAYTNKKDKGAGST